ncbi:MAG: hypothetical protein U5J98_08575 [Halobacteriales archaeon]|nr:hypothetical protein [Halobacteriales archaeon]
MTDRHLSLACDLNTVTWPVAADRVSTPGLDINFLALDDVNDMFRRMIRHQEFEASELSMSSYLMAVDQGGPEFVAVPVFPSRVFRHGFLFVNDDAGIDEPADLAGARVGVPSYSMTAALWERAIVQHEYGVAPTEMTWVQRRGQGTDEGDPLSLDLPDGLELEAMPPGRTLSGMLADGDLDALFAPSVPDSYDGETVRRLFPDYRAVETDYYERTGYFPIMHVLVLRRDVYEGEEWIAGELTRAFTEAKDRALDGLASAARRKLAIPWAYEHLERVTETFGDDYWPYGVEANREVLEAMCAYSHEQGLTSRQLSVDELFAPNTY